MLRLGNVAFNPIALCAEVEDDSLEIILSAPLAPGATIYYTTGGTTPTSQSAQYFAPLYVADFNEPSSPLPPTIINAVVVEPGVLDGPVTSLVLGINPPTIGPQPVSQSVSEGN